MRNNFVLFCLMICVTAFVIYVEVMYLPRDARNISKSGINHIMVRGIKRQDIFEDEEDIERLFETIMKYKDINVPGTEDKRLLLS